MLPTHDHISQCRAVLFSYLSIYRGKSFSLTRALEHNVRSFSILQRWSISYLYHINSCFSLLIYFSWLLLSGDEKFCPFYPYASWSLYVWRGCGVCLCVRVRNAVWWICTVNIGNRMKTRMPLNRAPLKKFKLDSASIFEQPSAKWHLIDCSTQLTSLYKFENIQSATIFVLFWIFIFPMIRCSALFSFVRTHT